MQLTLLLLASTLLTAMFLSLRYSVATAQLQLNQKIGILAWIFKIKIWKYL
jgi:hypothetical protein